jgi:hypothetical protein
MKNAVRIALALSALALAVPASAQQQPRPQVGIGVAIGSNFEFAKEVYVPIRVAPELKVEPSIGILTRDRTNGTKTSDFVLGVGVFWVKPLAAAADMYLGGRLKLDFAKSDDGVTSNSDTNVTIAAAIGGEYYLVPHFSFGVEGQLGHYDVGTAGFNAGDASGWFTDALLFGRIYF